MASSSAGETDFYERLRMACMNGDVLAVMDALEEDPSFDIDAQVDRHRSFTPLMLACENADGAELVRLLVEELGANVNLRNVSGRLGSVLCVAKGPFRRGSLSATVLTVLPTRRDNCFWYGGNVWRRVNDA